MASYSSFDKKKFDYSAAWADLYDNECREPDEIYEYTTEQGLRYFLGDYGLKFENYYDRPPKDRRGYNEWIKEHEKKTDDNDTSVAGTWSLFSTADTGSDSSESTSAGPAVSSLRTTDEEKQVIREHPVFFAVVAFPFFLISWIVIMVVLFGIDVGKMSDSAAHTIIFIPAILIDAMYILYNINSAGSGGAAAADSASTAGTEKDADNRNATDSQSAPGEGYDGNAGMLRNKNGTFSSQVNVISKEDDTLANTGSDPTDMNNKQQIDKKALDSAFGGGHLSSDSTNTSDAQESVTSVSHAVSAAVGLSAAIVSAVKDIDNARASVSDKEMKAKITEIEKLLENIIKAIKNETIPSETARKFESYYLPVVHKLIARYAELETYSIETPNIRATKKTILSGMDSATEAFRGIYNDLFANDVHDIASDISAFKVSMAQDGFADDDLDADAVDK